MNKILFSIIMATYNRASFIEETIDSILNQSFFDYELIIIDDGSTDHTEEVLQKYLKDSRLSFYLRPEKYIKGLPGCRNYGIDLSKGDYVVFIDDDDIVHPHLLELCNDELSDKDIDFCRYLRTTFTGNFQMEFDLEKRYEISQFNIEDLDLMVTNTIPFNSCQVVWKKSSFKSERFVETLMYAEEWEFYTRILALGLRGVTIEKILFYGRKHGASNTGEFRKNNPVRRESYIKAHGLVIDTLVEQNLLSAYLEKHFIRKGLLLKSKHIIEKILDHSDYSLSKKTLYKLGFKIYPLLRPIFYIKSKIKKH